jgi:hypothetical protein
MSRLLEAFMRIKYWFFGFILMAVLAACSPAVPQAETAVEPVATEVDTVVPSRTPEIAAEPTLSVPDEASQDEASQDEAAQPTPETILESGCTLVSSLPDPAQEYAEVFAVTSDDWTLGPQDAAITLIEYGDFQ